MSGGRGKIEPSDRTNGFDKNPQNINRTGLNRKLPELDKLCAEVLGKEEKGKTEAELILLAYLKQAKKGNVNAGEALLNRAYGKSIEKHEHTMIKGVEIIFTDDDINE